MDEFENALRSLHNQYEDAKAQNAAINRKIDELGLALREAQTAEGYILGASFYSKCGGLSLDSDFLGYISFATFNVVTFNPEDRFGFNWKGTRREDFSRACTSGEIKTQHRKLEEDIGKLICDIRFEITKQFLQKDHFAELMNFYETEIKQIKAQMASAQNQ